MAGGAHHGHVAQSLIEDDLGRDPAVGAAEHHGGGCLRGGQAGQALDALGWDAAACRRHRARGPREAVAGSCSPRHQTLLSATSSTTPPTSTQRATYTCDLVSHHLRSAFQPEKLEPSQVQESSAGQALPCIHTPTTPITHEPSGLTRQSRQPRPSPRRLNLRPLTPSGAPLVNMRSSPSNTCTSRAYWVHFGSARLPCFAASWDTLGTLANRVAPNIVPRRSCRIRGSGLDSWLRSAGAPGGKVWPARRQDGEAQHRPGDPAGTATQDGRELDRDWAKVRFDIVLAPARDERDEDRH